MALDFLPIHPGKVISADLLNQLIQAIQDGTIFTPGNTSTSVFSSFASRMNAVEAAIAILQAINGQLGEREQFVLTLGQSSVNLKYQPGIDEELVFLNGKALARTDTSATRDYKISGRLLTLESALANTIQAGDVLAVVYQHPISPSTLSVGTSAVSSAPIWIRKDYTYADFSASASTKTLTVASMPANACIDSVVVSATVPFEGPGVSGVEVDCQGIVLALDPSAPGSQYFSGQPSSLPFSQANQNLIFAPLPTQTQPPWTFVAADFLIELVAQSGNLNALTRGAFTIWIRYSVMP